MHTAKTAHALLVPVMTVWASNALAQQPEPAPSTATETAPSPAEPPAPVGQAPLESGPVPVQGKWNPVLYGFVEFDAIHDTTQSFSDQAANSPIQRPGTYGADRGRTMFGARNSRIGFKLSAPEIARIKPTAILEMDFFGNQSAIAQASGVTEAGFFTSPGLRIRHFALKLETPHIDVLVGQYWNLFGWQSYFGPNTVQIQGVPAQVYSRSPQVRLSRTFKTEALNFEIALAASRPAERDGELPDGQGGARIFVNNWKGLHTVGGTGTSVDALAVGISGIARRFNVPQFAEKPAASIKKIGWGLSVDALVPIIHATDKQRENALTLTGSYVRGTGINDLYSGLTGGVTFPTLPNPSGASPAPTYPQDTDSGLVTYDQNAQLHTIKWQSYFVGAQYYLPPSGHVWISGNYAHLNSDNAGTFGLTSSKVFTKSEFADVNLFWDVVTPVRFGIEYAYFQQTYADGVEAKNHRVQASAWYIF